ncbi:MAG: hypothetical protein ABIJ10_02380 [Candidatus Micrarchaeota archaeon]
MNRNNLRHGDNGNSNVNGAGIPAKAERSSAIKRAAAGAAIILASLSACASPETGNDAGEYADAGPTCVSDVVCSDSSATTLLARGSEYDLGKVTVTIISNESGIVRATLKDACGNPILEASDAADAGPNPVVLEASVGGSDGFYRVNSSETVTLRALETNEHGAVRGSIGLNCDDQELQLDAGVPSDADVTSGGGEECGEPVTRQCVEGNMFRGPVASGMEVELEIGIAKITVTEESTVVIDLVDSCDNPLADPLALSPGASGTVRVDAEDSVDVSVSDDGVTIVLEVHCGETVTDGDADVDVDIDADSDVVESDGDLDGGVTSDADETVTPDAEAPVEDSDLDGGVAEDSGSDAEAPVEDSGLDGGATEDGDMTEDGGAVDHCGITPTSEPIEHEFTGGRAEEIGGTSATGVVLLRTGDARFSIYRGHGVYPACTTEGDPFYTGVGPGTYALDGCHALVSIGTMARADYFRVSVTHTE